MVVIVLSVQCLPPPFPPPFPPPPPLSDVVCHVTTQCVLRCRTTVLAEAGRCPCSLSLSSCLLCFFITRLHFNPPPSIDFHFLCSIVHLLSHSAGNASPPESNFSVIHAFSSIGDSLSISSHHITLDHFVFPAELCGPEKDLAQRRGQPCTSFMVMPSCLTSEMLWAVFSPHKHWVDGQLSAHRNTKQPYSEDEHRPVTSSMLWWLHCHPVCSKNKRIALKIGPTTK